MAGCRNCTLDGRRMMSGSANRLYRKGCTSSRLSGPPRLSSSTPMRSAAGVAGGTASAAPPAASTAAAPAPPPGTAPPLLPPCRSKKGGEVAACSRAPRLQGCGLCCWGGACRQPQRSTRLQATRAASSRGEEGFGARGCCLRAGPAAGALTSLQLPPCRSWTPGSLQRPPPAPQRPVLAALRRSRCAKLLHHWGCSSRPRRSLERCGGRPQGEWMARLCKTSALPAPRQKPPTTGRSVGACGRVRLARASRLLSWVAGLYQGMAGAWNGACSLGNVPERCGTPTATGRLNAARAGRSGSRASDRGGRDQAGCRPWCISLHQTSAAALLTPPVARRCDETDCCRPGQWAAAAMLSSWRRCPLGPAAGLHWGQITPLQCLPAAAHSSRQWRRTCRARRARLVSQMAALVVECDPHKVDGPSAPIRAPQPCLPCSAAAAAAAVAMPTLPPCPWLLQPTPTLMAATRSTPCP